MNTKPLKLAIVGLRHSHVYNQVVAARELEGLELVAVCEEDAATREKLDEKELGVPVYHSYQQLLDEVDTDIIGIGDYYGIRGQRAIQALQHGKHILSDKPLCTDLNELEAIESLASEKKLQVSCQFGMRENGAYLRLRRLIHEGELGQVHAVAFTGQHPLNLGVRPEWYFEEGKQGGTINDIGIHAFDFVPWLTGLQYSRITVARDWNARVSRFPKFREAAQFMLELENGAGVQGDVSYLTPESFGFSMEQYWRITIWGDKGAAETHLSSNTVSFYPLDATQKILLDSEPPQRFANMQSFLQQIKGETPCGLCTAEVLAAMRVSLLTQKAANERAAYVDIAP